MAHEIRLPRLGWSMEVGTFVGWLKADGDFVQEGEALFELESEKASQEIESIDEGILRIPPDAPLPGTELPVGALLAYLVSRHESLPWESSGDVAESATETAQEGGLSDQEAPSSPSIRKLARELGVSLNEITGSGARGRITQQDVRQHAAQLPASPADDAAEPTSNGTRVVATPRARRVANELGVDWAGLKGTGKHGRVRETDVRQAAASAVDARTALESSRPPAGRLTGNCLPISKLRRIIAQRMLVSHQSTAPVTLTTQANAANLSSARTQFKTAGQAQFIPTLTDMVIRIVAVVLPQHLLLAGRWNDDGIVLPTPDGINIGLAVDTNDGLLVPVVHDAARKSLMDITQSTTTLIERARAGTLSLEHLQGGVFTVTNLGSFGIDAFTPVINSPESAILGIGAIRREAVVEEDDRIAVGLRITLSLTFDHRVVDGAPAAKFLADVREAIESPLPYLI